MRTPTQEPRSIYIETGKSTYGEASKTSGNNARSVYLADPVSAPKAYSVTPQKSTKTPSERKSEKNLEKKASKKSIKV